MSLMLCFLEISTLARGELGFQLLYAPRKLRAYWPKPRPRWLHWVAKVERHSARSRLYGTAHILEQEKTGLAMMDDIRYLRRAL
ncbi:hypothetical protein BJ166DRAFT_317904 [Pestalotiopsis sp. NC0098]|nr:hypothetical protein BJ166DRAFT_317904 [Pestalotiopsis sp. NC0098]